MAKQDNTIWWVLGIIFVVVILVGGGFGALFGTERGKCLKNGGEWVDDAFTGGKYCLQQTLSRFKNNCDSSRGGFRQVTANDPDFVTDQLGGQNFCDCSVEGEGEIRYDPRKVFHGCGFAFAH